jgi:mRNA interferase RelE/StbE
MAGNYKIVVVDGVVRKHLPRIDAAMRQRIQTAIAQKLTSAPLDHAKLLRHRLSGYWSLRVGDYRVIFRLDRIERIVTICSIKHRADVYMDDILN